MNTLEFLKTRTEGQRVRKLVYSDVGIFVSVWTDEKLSVNGIAVVNRGKGNSLEPALIDLDQKDVAAIDVASDVECNFNMGTCTVDCVLMVIVLKDQRYGFIYPRDEVSKIREFADDFAKSR